MTKCRAVIGHLNTSCCSSLLREEWRGTSRNLPDLVPSLGCEDSCSYRVMISCRSWVNILPCFHF